MRPSLLLFFFIITVSGSGQSGLPISRTYPLKDGELGRSVWGITQDKRGIIYLATDRGVMEYDGARFTLLDTPPAFGVITDDAGIIYVSCKRNFGMLTTRPNGAVYFKSLFQFDNAPFKFEDVNLVISKNKVVAISYEAVLEYDRNKNTAIVYRPSGDLFSNGFIQDDTTYISVISQGLHYLSEGKIYKAPYSDWFKPYHDGKMNANFTRNEKERFVIFGPTVIRYYGKAAVPKVLPLVPNELEGSYLYSAFPFDEKYKVITTINKGAIVIDTAGNVLQVFNKARRLPGNAISNGFKDQNDNIWFTFEFNKKPLAKTELGKDIMIWNESSGIKGNILSINQMKNELYVATDQNLYSINRSGNVTSHLKPFGNAFTFWTQYKTGSSDVMMGVVDNQSVGEYKNGKVNIIYYADGWCNMRHSKRYPDRLYLCDYQKFGYFTYQHEEWKFHELTKVNGYKNFVETNDGFIWASTESSEEGDDHSVNNQRTHIRITPPSVNDGRTKIDRYAAHEGLPDVNGRIMLFENEVLFLYGKGILHFNAALNRFETWKGAGKKLNDILLKTSKMEYDSARRIHYFVANNKLTSMHVGDHGDTTYFDHAFQRFEAIGEIHGLTVDPEGVVWVAGVDGVVSYDRRKDTRNYDQNFQCFIRSVTLGADSIIIGGGIHNDAPKVLPDHLNFNFGKLTINYAAPFFDKEEETEYSYQLVGRDKQWSAWEKIPRKEFEGLREGHYTFQVKAKNIYEKESGVASISFSVEPPWFRTWWASSFYILVGFGAIAGLWYWRTWSLVARKNQLTTIVKEQTKELTNSYHELTESHSKLIELNKELAVSQEELKQGNEELSTMNDYLKRMQHQLVQSEKMASLGQLTAGIAHEINNPINFISGGVSALEYLQSDLIENFSKLTPEEVEQRKVEMQELINTINNGVVRTSNIIKSLKTFSSPSEEITDISISIKDCIDGAITLMASKLSKLMIKLEKNYDQPFKVRANAAQISQVIVNLIDNAIDAFPQHQEKKLITVRTYELPEAIVTTVQDNAGGIPDHIKNRIFEPFFTTKEVGKGTGLGLSICYSIIERHGGKLRVESVPGEGTTFYVELPK